MTNRTAARPPSARLARLAPVVATLALLLAACGGAPVAASATTPGSTPASAPAVTPAPTPVPTPAASSAAAGAAACAPASLAVTSTGWDAAAGSRGTSLSVRNGGGAPCAVGPGLSVALIDASGHVLFGADANLPPRELGPGASGRFDVLASNWCGGVPAAPVRVAVRLGGATLGAEGGDEGADGLPPCMGPGSDAVLSVNGWKAG